MAMLTSKINLGIYVIILTSLLLGCFGRDNRAQVFDDAAPLIDSSIKKSSKQPVNPRTRGLMQIVDSLENHVNTVYITRTRYRYGGDFNAYLDIVLKNNTKQNVIGISFRIDGYLDKGCQNSYEMTRKVKLNPGKEITLTQPIKKGDCKDHRIDYIHYVSKDGTLEIGI